MKSAVLLLSGGMDSATCLAILKEQGTDVYALSFNYGQRHLIELEMASRLAALADVKEHCIIGVSSLEQIGNSSLLDGTSIGLHKRNNTLPSTFVPGRNILFLTLAAAYAYKKNIYQVVTGISQVDYSRYPDCRMRTIHYLQDALIAGMEYDLSIQTPLMFKTKKEIILSMKFFGKLDWYKQTHTCYEGNVPPCQKCPACILRAKGFEEAGLKDPLLT